MYITSQNHGYYVDKLPDNVTATYINVNDGTIEGMKQDTSIYSVQFHPETTTRSRMEIIYSTSFFPFSPKEDFVNLQL